MINPLSYGRVPKGTRVDTATRTRNVDPEVARLRGLLGPLKRDGRHAEAAIIRVELDKAVRLAAIKVAAKNAPPLDPATLGSIVAMLASAVEETAVAA